VVKPYTNEKFWISWFGAFDIDPKHLSYHICVETDRTKNELQDNVVLMQELRNVLQELSYPPQASDQVFISFAAQETVDRDFGGNWYYYFK
jgi:hypothetical protein